MSNEDFFQRVYRIVEQIPYGRVTTYGAIAEALGVRSSARLVGWALNQVTYREDLPELPCHRVVNREGRLTGKAYFGGNVMEERLRQEGIAFIEENRIDLKRHFWKPDVDKAGNQ